MSKETGAVIAEAGTRYGRRFLWINYTATKTGKTYNSAFWDAVLILSPLRTPILPGLTPNHAILD